MHPVLMEPPPPIHMTPLSQVDIVGIGVMMALGIWWFFSTNHGGKYVVVGLLIVRAVYVQTWIIPQLETAFAPNQILTLETTQVKATLKVLPDPLNPQQPAIEISNSILSAQVWVHGELTIAADPIGCTTLPGIGLPPRYIAIRCTNQQMRIMHTVEPIRDYNGYFRAVPDNYDHPLLLAP